MPLSYFTRRASEPPAPEQQSTPAQEQIAPDSPAATEANVMAPPQTPATASIAPPHNPATPILAPPQMPLQALQHHPQSFSWAASGHVNRDGNPDKSTSTTSTIPANKTLKDIGGDIIIKHKHEKSGKIIYRADADFLVCRSDEGMFMFSLQRLLDELLITGIRNHSEDIFLSGHDEEDVPIMTDVHFSSVLRAIWMANPDKLITTWLTLGRPHEKRDREREEGEVSDDSRASKRAKSHQQGGGAERRGEAPTRGQPTLRGAGRGERGRGRGRGGGGIAIGPGDYNVSTRFGAREYRPYDHYP